MNAWKRLVPPVLAAFAVGCSSGGGGPAIGPIAVATVEVSPQNPALQVGQSMQLFAFVKDSSGNVLSGRVVVWRSDDAAVFTIAATGNITGIAAGSARARATAGGVEGSVTVTVAAPASATVVSSITINPVSAVVVEGSTQQLTAVTRDARGNVVTGRAVAWTAADPGMANVDAGGLVTALRPGVSTVEALSDGRTATASLRVQAAYPFALLYGLSLGGGVELQTLDINDPAAVAMPVFAPGESASHPTASPDGSKLAFVAMSAGQAHVWSANRDGSGRVQLTAAAGINDQPAWSPDGARIAYRHRPPGGGTGIWVMDASDGGNAMNLTADQGATSQTSPAWSPNLGGSGYRIAYSHSAAGQGNLWTMRDDGSDKRQITASATAYDEQPNWSPDGTRLVFMRSDAGVFGDLYVVDAVNGGAGALLMQLAGPLAGSQFMPRYSPDGSLISFISKHSGNYYQIYTVWADGTRLAQRTVDSEDHSDATWLAATP